MSQRFKSRPGTIEAVQWDGTAESLAAVIEFAGEDNITHLDHGSIDLWVDANDSWLILTRGEWIIRDLIDGDHGPRFYPCKPEVFAQRWELDS